MPSCTGMASTMKTSGTSINADAVGDDDYALLHRHGFDDEDIWDIVAITAFFGLSNRIANATSMRPNEEFYLMGRIPRSDK